MAIDAVEIRVESQDGTIKSVATLEAVTKPDSTPPVKFTKVKFNGDKVEIHAIEEDSYSNSKKSCLISEDEPMDSFNDALQSLSEDLAVICEIDIDDDHPVEIRGVTISWDDTKLPGKFYGAVITGLRSLTDCHTPMVINTPWLPSYQYSDDNENPQLPWSTITKIEALLDEAKRYWDGKRKVEQLKLGLE